MDGVVAVLRAQAVGYVADGLLPAHILSACAPLRVPLPALRGPLRGAHGAHTRTSLPQLWSRRARPAVLTDIAAAQVGSSGPRGATVGRAPAGARGASAPGAHGAARKARAKRGHRAPGLALAQGAHAERREQRARNLRQTSEPSASSILAVRSSNSCSSRSSSLRRPRTSSSWVEMCSSACSRIFLRLRGLSVR